MTAGKKACKRAGRPNVACFGTGCECCLWWTERTGIREASDAEAPAAGEPSRQMYAELMAERDALAADVEKYKKANRELTAKKNGTRAVHRL